MGLRPVDAEAFNNRGLAYDALEEYERAMEDYSAAVMLVPDFPAALNNRGAANEAMGKEENALADYLEALAADPKFAVAWYNAARQYARQGQIELCLQHLDEAVRLDSPFADEAPDDENLGWILKLMDIKEDFSRQGKN